MQKYKKSIINIVLFFIVVLIIFIVITCIYAKQEKNFKATIRQAEEVHIMSGNTGESISLSKEDIEKLANKIDEINFKLVLFPKQYDGWSYRILYKIGDTDWSMLFGGGFIQIEHGSNSKYYQRNHELEEYIGAMYKELGGK